MNNKNIHNHNQQKNRISIIIGLVLCVILVIYGIVSEIVVFREEALRGMGKIQGFDGSGLAVLFVIIPVFVVASVISLFCRKRALGVVKTIFGYLSPLNILIIGLVLIPMLAIAIIALLVGQ